MTQSQPNQYEDTELRKTICKIFGVFPEELKFNLPGGIETKKVEELEQLIESVATRREQVAELQAYENVLDNSFDLSKRDKENLERFIAVLRQSLNNKEVKNE